MSDLNVVVATLATTIAFLVDEEETLNSEDENKRKHRYWMRRWYLYRYDRNQVNTMYKFQNELLELGDVGEFRACLRMPPDVYENLLEDIRPLITKRDTNYRRAISAEERLSLTMRYLALGESFKTLRHAYRVGLCTVGRIIRETCDAIYTKLQPIYLVTPDTEEGWIEIANLFQHRWNFPHVCGALDGKHVRLVCPPNSGSMFYNYKLYYSIILMALVDANYRFIYVDVGAEGKASDGGIWRNTSLFDLIAEDNNLLNFPEDAPVNGIESDIPYYLVADDAFALSPHLMKPYPIRNLSTIQRIFNYRISRSRMVVENAFGILASKFRIFRRDIEMRPEGAEKVVLACVVLHNMLREKCGRSYIPPRSVDYEDDQHIRQRGLWRAEDAMEDIEPTRIRHPTKYALKLRDRLSNYFLQKEGEVIWQYSASVLEKSFK